MATLSPGLLTTVPLTFRRNNAVSVSSNFVDNVSQIAAGFTGTYALMMDDTVKAWGSPGAAFSLTPAPVPLLTSVVQVSGGAGFACARKSDGTVWCWGANPSGALGPNVPLNAIQTTPVQIPITGASDISAGGAHVCAITFGGFVRCWGQNSSGQLGNGSTVDSPTPVMLPFAADAGRVYAGTFHSCYLQGDGEVSCWGNNFSGQLGDGTTVNRSTPAIVPGLMAQTEMTLGISHTCSMRADGLVRCWGANGFGQLGDGTTMQRLTPGPVTGLTDALQLVGGQHFNCVRRQGGLVSCWGQGVAIGDGVGDPRWFPTPVANLTAPLAIRAHLGNHACAEMPGRTVKCWGDNSSGQIGDGTMIVAAKPTNVALQ